MVTFFICLILLILGFFTYSKLVEKIFRIDDRPTPAVAHPDGVDYVPMKTWRIFLVQLLNIAGLGPIYGALSGACWGPSVYLWIVFGTILGGGVHDFLSGMMSERNDGKSISEVVGLYMGKVIAFIMRVFSVVLLVMVGVNFSVGPAGLLAELTPDWMGTMFWLVVIMIYYLIATFLPIDKIIGKLYPVFGICLIIMALGIGGGILIQMGGDMPELSIASLTTAHPGGLPGSRPLRRVQPAPPALPGRAAGQTGVGGRRFPTDRRPGRPGGTHPPLPPGGPLPEQSPVPGGFGQAGQTLHRVLCRAQPPHRPLRGLQVAARHPQPDRPDPVRAVRGIRHPTL